jgi:phosphatidate cytidylyltransferase
MLFWRLISAAAFLTPLVSLFVADYYFSGDTPGLWLLPITLLVAALAGGELVDLIASDQQRPSRWLVQLGVTLIVLSSAAPLAWGLVGATYPADCPFGKLGWPLTATALCVTLLLIHEMIRFEKPGDHFVKVAFATFVLVYIGLLLSFLFPLRSFQSNSWGMAAVVSVLLIVKMSDIGAYTVGKLFGRTKLVPRLSPGKTVEGALGGLATAAIVSWAYFAWSVPSIVGEPTSIPAWRCVLYGLILGVSAIVGDLSESLIKRDMGRKDSSRWLPGLGGILDLLDSVLIAGPTAYACWSAGLLGPH